MIINQIKFILFLIVQIVYVQGIQVINKDAVIVNKNVNVLGVDLSYALIDAEFDTELYKYDSLSCPQFQCPDYEHGGNENLDCSCDYTVFPMKARNPSCQPCPEVSHKVRYDSGEWEVLELDTVYNRLVSVDKPLNFRYKPDGLGCKGLFLKVTSIDGFGMTYVGASPNTVYNRYSSEFKAERHLIYNICPDNNWDTELRYTYTESWTRDTYFITVSSQTPTFNFSIVLHSEDVPKLPDNPPSCQSDEEGCVENGQVKYGMAGGLEQIHYTFNVEESSIYTFAAPCMYQNVMYYLSDEKGFPSYNDNKWRLSEDFDNYLVLYLEKSTKLYITAEVSYDTNFTFSISNYHTLYQYSIESSPSVQAGALSLTSTSRLILPDGSSFGLPAYSDSLEYSILYPSLDINVLYPVPAFFYSSEKFDYKKIKNVLNNIIFKPKSYQVAYLLSSSIGSSNVKKNRDFETIKNSTLELLSTLFDKNGNPFSLKINFKEKELECINDEFSKVLDTIISTEKVFFNISDLDELNSYRYALDSLTMSDAWVGCSVSALKYLEQNIVYRNVSVRNCPYETSDPRYAEDPCCDYNAAYYQCCNPSIVSLPFIEYPQANKSLVSKECSSLDCTLSVLSDYSTSLSSIDSCSIPDSEPISIQLESLTILRECQQLELTPPYCTFNSDCQGYGLEKCNIYTRQCSPDFEIIDKAYVKCVLNRLSKSTIFSLLKGSTIVDDNAVSNIYQQHQIEDCIGLNDIKDRSKYQWKTNVHQSVLDCYPSQLCLDESCLNNHDTCMDSIYQFWGFKLQSKLENCTNFGYCPQTPCSEDYSGPIDQDGNLCIDTCDTEFCGYCNDENSECHNANQDFSTETSCQDQSLCLLPNGQYISGLTEDECDQKGFCTAPCDYECVSVIPDTSITKCVTRYNETECSNLNDDVPGSTQWLVDGQICLYLLATVEEDCNAIANFTWIDCSTRVNKGECVGTIDLLSICYLKEIPCETEAQCNSVGTCSDDFYFNPTVGNPYYNKGQGKCVFPHAYYQNYITCQVYYQNDSPNGCYSIHPYYITEEECSNANGTWWIPARNENECISQFGCKVLENQKKVQNLPYNYYFNEMGQELCENCFESFNQWTNKFDFTPATWLKGIYKKTQWYKDRSFVSNSIESVFSYQDFYTSVMVATKTNVADIFRSEAYCRFERLQSNLDSITCSCSGEGGKQCFDMSTPLLGQVKACSDVSSYYSFDYGFISFTNNSIYQGCQSLSFSQVSREIYKSAQPLSLASNFVSYKKPDAFGIVNSNDAIIGTLIGDGVKIKSQDGINSLTICLEFDQNKKSSDYPIFDFASQNNNQKSPLPLGVETFTSSYLITTTGITIECLCANITNISENDPIYFPIHRIDDWKTSEKEIFDSLTKGLMYTLAVLFLIVAVWGFYEIGLIIIARIKGLDKKVFQLVHLLIIIVTLFITIRSVYFFLLVKGHLSNSPVADYIMVVLPTFIYFSSFILIVLLWYIIVYVVLKKNRSTENLSKRLYKLVLIINSILYLLFIGIVLVFQYTKKEYSNDCGSRIINDAVSTGAQKGVSIAYAVIQAFISLLISCAFAYLGIKISKAMRVTKIKIGSKSNHEKKIFILTLACTLGFILHCAFVLIMVATEIQSIIFSFIGLVITELMPAVSILYCYDQKHPIRQKSTSSEGGSGGSNNSGNGKRLSTFISDSNIRSSNSFSPSDFSMTPSGNDIENDNDVENENDNDVENSSVN